MKIITRLVLQSNADGSFTELERDSYDYHGPVVCALGGGGGRSTRSTTSSQVIDTTSVGLQDTSGIGVAGGGDVNVEIQTTDLGAVQGAFDFTQDFSEGAFSFASDVAKQAGQTAERALETSQQAVATVATGGQSDLSKIDSKTIGIAVAALVAVLVLPQIFRRA